jgi:murein DD-endopeptidase MepM/ murein hydrolase activator NlpD
MIKKILLIILIVICAFAFLGLVSTDKQYFICPIEYKNDVIIRKDHRGDGTFASNRSGRRMHKGLDLLADVGTAVCAAKSGKIISATQNKGMGKYIIVRHRDNIITIYGHLSNILVSKGDLVRQGQVIGGVGKTGNARPADMLPHLHFEIRKKGVPVDPLEYI